MKLNGIAASSGIVIGKVYKYVKEEMVITDDRISNIQDSITCFENAIEKSVSEISKIKVQTIEKMDAEHGIIFDAHIQILKDPVMYESVVSKIEKEMINPAKAFKTISDEYAAMFEAMDDAYMSERAADIRDVSSRVLTHILGHASMDLSTIDSEVVLIAEDLTPSDTAQLNKEFVKGFVTDIGGRTSHSAIMARTLEIPAVVGTDSITRNAVQGDIIILDGIDGEVFINPSDETISDYKMKIKAHEKRKSEWALLKHQATETACGHHVELAANIGSPNDIEGVLKNGGEGVGLYRTEFLYMDSDDFPSEDEQYEAYKKVLEAMGDKPVVIRTLDIGGDKELSYMDMPHELNPFLGHRAIRLCFEKKEMFKTQLRALLRASVHGKLNIMFPMIATMGEFREAKKVLLESKEELLSLNIEVSESIQIGIMVEIPAAALLADKLAKEVDFFSIGTNDLIQYTFAADRMNEKVSYLYQPFNPSLLRLIKMVIDAAHKEGKWVGMCGEMAGDSIAIPILIGLGLDEFSMSAPSILPARSLIKGLERKSMESLAERALDCETNEEVISLVNNHMK